MEQPILKLKGVVLPKQEVIANGFNPNVYEETFIDQRMPDILWKKFQNFAIALFEDDDKYMIVNLDDEKSLDLKKVNVN